MVADLLNAENRSWNDEALPRYIDSATADQIVKIKLRPTS